MPLPRGEPVLFERPILCFSDLVCGRVLPRAGAVEAASVDGTG
jgi:hypothetical protein